MEQQSSQPGYAPGGAPGGRPGQVTAAAVILFVLGGLGVLFGAIGLIGTLAVSNLLGGLTAIFVILLVLTIVVSGLQILAGVRVLQLQASGKTLAIVLSAIGIVLAIVGLIIGGEPVSSIIGIVLNGLIIFFLQQNQHAFTR